MVHVLALSAFLCVMNDSGPAQAFQDLRWGLWWPAGQAGSWWGCLACGVGEWAQWYLEFREDQAPP